MGRGTLSKEVLEISKKVFGYEVTQRELRLLPYIGYLVLNDKNIDPNSINKEERAILTIWREKGYLTGGASNLKITKEFWDAMNQVLWVGYIAYSD